MTTTLAREIGDLLAIGYLRHRKRQARQMAVEKEAPRAEKPLDDVAPEGRVPLPENRTPENGGKP
jgi:hypothetical protein